MEDPIKVTFLFVDDEHFHRFLESNQIDVYTYNWKKHEYLVNLAADVKTSMPKSQAPEEPVVDESRRVYADLN